MPSSTAHRGVLLLAAAATLALLAALGLQYLGGLSPCPLCLWARYPYVGVLAVAGLGLWLGRPRAALLGIALLLAVDVGIAGYHVGVEQGVLALPESCAADGQPATIEELRAQLAAQPRPRCDQVQLAVLGLSLAAWNGILAAVLLVAALAFRWRSRGSAGSAAEQHGHRRAA